MSAECSAGNIPPGCKQTEVGVIPEDWDTKPCSSLSDLITVGIVIRPTQYYAKQGVPALRSANIREKGIDDTDMVFISEKANALLSKSQLRTGDVLTVRTGYPGTSAVVTPSFSGSNCIDILITRPSKAVSPTFLSAWINSPFGKSQVLRNQGGLAQQHFNVSDLRNLVVALPPTKTEQESIAEALSDTDALLESLEQLIAKKRQIKQGAMQELLTGKRRLPGFSGEWETKMLGNTAVLKARIGWQGLTTNEYLDYGDYYLVTGTEFKDGYIDWSNCHYIAESRYKQDKNIQLKEHDVLVTKDGTIGKVALINHLHKPATLNSGVFVIRPIDDAFHPEFFYYLLCSNIFTEFLVQLSAGSTINHLYQKDFVNFIYRTPATIEEQTAIAATLSDMDSEITALEEKLAKARQIKQGMMQELLTGRIRLP